MESFASIRARKPRCNQTSAALSDTCHHQPGQQCIHPVAVPCDQHVVDEHLEHRRHGQARNEQGERGQNGEGQRVPGVA